MPSLALFANYEPAWASWGNWLILALDRDHIKHIVDAQYGLTPRIAALPNVQRLNYYAAERSTIAVIQPDLASDLVAQWLSDFDAGRASLLDPDWWELPNADEDFLHDDLGIVLAEEFEPGVVTVGEVLPDMPAAGGIQAGDRIVGVDSVLLDLDYPEASLRRIHERGTLGQGARGTRSTVDFTKTGASREKRGNNPTRRINDSSSNFFHGIQGAFLDAFVGGGGKGFQKHTVFFPTDISQHGDGGTADHGGVAVAGEAANRFHTLSAFLLST